jgi:two-component system, NarL family, response regulator LiaR
MAKRRIRLLLADDHTVTRQGLVALLGEISDIEVAGEAINGREAVYLAREILPDVVIMDVVMPEMNGIEATRIIRSELPQINVLGLSMSDESAEEMRHAGAADYVSKMAPWEVIMEAIRSCASASRRR